MTNGPSSNGWHAGLGTYIRCPKEHQFEFIRKIRKPSTETPEALAVGLFVHAGRAAWFNSGFRTDEVTWQSIVAEVQREAETLKLPSRHADETFALFLLEKYIEHWSARPLPRVVCVEKTLGPWNTISPDPVVQALCKYTCRVDDVSFYAEAEDQTCIGELKTDSMSVNNCVEMYTQHGQLLLQHLLARMDMMLPKATILDVIVKDAKSPKFARVLIPVTEHQLKWFAHEVAVVAMLTVDRTWNSDPHRNITACTRPIGRGKMPCPYRSLCMNGQGSEHEYTFEDGSSLSSWTPSPEKEAPPWK